MNYWTVPASQGTVSRPGFKFCIVLWFCFCYQGCLTAPLPPKLNPTKEKKKSEVIHFHKERTETQEALTPTSLGLNTQTFPFDPKQIFLSKLFSIELVGKVAIEENKWSSSHHGNNTETSSFNITVCPIQFRFGWTSSSCRGFFISRMKREDDCKLAKSHQTIFVSDTVWNQNHLEPQFRFSVQMRLNFPGCNREMWPGSGSTALKALRVFIQSTTVTGFVLSSIIVKCYEDRTGSTRV